jgi:hypothetical protein
VVACREQQALRLDRRERVIPWANSCAFKSSLIPISEQRPEVFIEADVGSTGLVEPIEHRHDLLEIFGI